MIIEFAKGGAFLLALCSIQALIAYRWRRNELVGQAISGLAFGGICIVGMMTPITAIDDAIFDARSVILAASGLFGGPVAGALAAILAGGFRLWLGGPGAAVGIGVVVVCVGLGLVYRECVSRGWLAMRPAELLAFGFVVHLATLGLFWFLPGSLSSEVLSRIAIPMLVAFTPATALLAWLLKLVGDRIATQQSLEEANARFRELTENIREAFFMTTPARDEVVYMSPAYEEIWGRSVQSLYDEPLSYLDSVHPDDVENVKSTIAQNRYSEYQHTYRIARPDGSIRNIRVKAFPIRDAAGKVYRIAGIAEDITELEERGEQLRQAQKMEALGQLTGGVAHDFNNLLQIIQGNAEVLGDRVAAGDPALAAILRASARGSELTQRLLSFARRQSLSAAPVDVPELADRVGGLLKRTLGPHVRLSTDFAHDIWPVHADPGQLENALVNLAINARDAISGNGSIVFSGANVTVREADAGTNASPAPGEYVRICVTDDGCGMSDETLRQAFEPFFTTKDVGEGSGLGLSMVYGFARQSGGLAAIESKAGNGTTVAIYLPRAAAPAATNTPPKPRESIAGTGQTVLVVEDEPDVRALAVAMVRSLGYRAAEAGTAEEAISVLRREGATAPVDVLLCDVVLPDGMSGAAIAETARSLHPGLKIAFMSGYPQGHGKDMRALGDAFLPKPFRKADLKRVLASLLNPGPADGGSSRR